jgi:hypothetical protein
MEDSAAIPSRFVYQRLSGPVFIHAASELETLAAHVSTDFPYLQKIGIHFAIKEEEPGLGCWTCLGHIPKAIEETDCVMDDGIELLKERFRNLDADFQIMPRGQALPFPGLWGHFNAIKHLT